MSRVLVVEDSTSARDVVMRILRREGYDVMGAANGFEALNVLQKEHADLVLLDVMMPEMDGMTLLSRLREKADTRELPVILMTALSDEGRMNRAKELGVREYLIKTKFSYDDLVTQVEKHVDRH